MSDSYIDLDETQIYGPYAVARITKRLIGKVPAFDPTLTLVCDTLTQASKRVADAVAAARGAQADIRAGSQKKQSPLGTARDFLTRFASHLDAHPSGAVDDHVFFVDNGSPSGVGRSAAKQLQALQHVARELGKPDSPVKSAAEWRTEAEAIVATLEAPTASSEDAQHARRDATPETDAARDAWLVAYLVARDIVRGMLRHLGQVGLLDTFFHDLAVPDSRKVTRVPDDGTD